MRTNEANEIPKMLKCMCVLQYMEEFAELLLPVTDPRHQVVERVVQHLAQRNKDIPEVSDVTWSVHVVQSPNTNAFVLPVSKRKTDVELQTSSSMSFISCYCILKVICEVVLAKQCVYMCFSCKVSL